MSQLQVTGEAKIRDIQGPVVANSGVITALDGAASQYVRGDGTLADFPTSSGGGSSVSYYLNSSVSQGTIGGVAYRELSKEPIIGAGTDIAIAANGYVASYLTDANDPDVLSIPGGNFNCEFYFSVNNDTGNPFFYAELYKYDGTTFTLLGSSVGVPEYINQGTIIAPYYFAIPVPTSALAVTDRLAIRIYVNVDGRTVTLHTENSHLCQVVTTLSKGMVSLNNLTDQSQYLTTGTSGTDFNIVSSGDTHTFNIPSASASNRGLITTGSQTIAGIKTLSVPSQFEQGLYLKQNMNLFQAGYIGLGASTTGLIVGLSGGGFGTLNFNNTTSFTYTFPDATGTIALLEGTQTFTGAKTFTQNLSLDGNGSNAGTLLLKSNSALPTAIGYTGINSTNNSIYLTTFVSNPKTAALDLSGLSDNIIRTFTFPNASGTIALTSNLSSYVPYTGATTNVDLGANSLTATSLLGKAIFATNSVGTSGGLIALSIGSTFSTYSGHNTIAAAANGIFVFLSDISSGTAIKDARFNFGSLTNGTTRTYTFPDSTGTIALTSNLSSYVPYTGATTNVDLGARNLSSYAVNVNGDGTSGGALNLKMYNSLTLAGVGYLSIYAQTDYYFALAWNFVSGTKQAIFNNVLIPINNTRYYNLPNADGTLALTSDLSAYLPLAGGTLTGALNGTTATFTGTVSSIVTSGGTSFRVVNSVNSRAWSLVPSTNGAESDLWLYYGGTGGGTKVSFVNNGNVLIGSTTDSGELLQVNGTSKFTGALSGTSATFSGNVTIKGNTNQQLILDYTTASGGFTWQTFAISGVNKYRIFGNTDNTFILYSDVISSNVLSIASTGAATFSSSVTAGDVLTITSNISTSYALNLIGRNTTGNASTINFFNNAGSSRYGFIYVDSSTYEIGSISGSNIPLTFSTNQSERMRITSGGNVGIGTSSPAYPLQVRRAGGGGSLGISIDSVGTTDRAVQYFAIQDNAAGVGAGHAFYYRTPSSTTDTLGLLLNEDGNVGIGTSSPSAQLDVATTARFHSSSNWMQFQQNVLTSQNNDGAHIRSVVSADSAPTYSWAGDTDTGMYTPSANTIAFTTAATERARITSGGNVLIGTTDSTHRLSVVVQSGADREILIAAISGASNGFRVTWNHATSTTRVSISSIPTSSAGLPSGTLWNDGGTLKIA